jgi:hypothetical protein
MAEYCKVQTVVLAGCSLIPVWLPRQGAAGGMNLQLEAIRDGRKKGRKSPKNLKYDEEFLRQPG